MKTNKNCQSCGMPLKKDNMGGGTNVDGSISKTYCSKCYENGAFKEPNITMLEMQLKVKEKISSVGIPGIVAGFTPVVYLTWSVGKKSVKDLNGLNLK